MYLQVNDLVFLLDCGWDEGCSEELLSPLRDVTGHLDAVLLSHPDPLHLGALPVRVRYLSASEPGPLACREQHVLASALPVFPCIASSALDS